MEMHGLYRAIDGVGLHPLASQGGTDEEDKTEEQVGGMAARPAMGRSTEVRGQAHGGVRLWSCRRLCWSTSSRVAPWTMRV